MTAARTFSRGEPRGASGALLAQGTLLALPMLYICYRGDLTQPGGPAPVALLYVAFPSISVFVRQRVRRARRALWRGLLAGIACGLAVSALLGFDQDWADYTGIAVGMIPFDIVFWAVTRDKPAGPAEHC